MKVKVRLLSSLFCSMIFCILIPCCVFAADSPREINGLQDLTAVQNVPYEDLDADGNGYTWDSDGGDGYILTLKNVHIVGDDSLNSSGSTGNYAFKIPNGKKVTIKTDAASVLDGGIDASSSVNYPLDLFFDGPAALEINGTISCGSTGDKITVQNGANVKITERIVIGDSGVGSHISVIGQDSTLILSEVLHSIGSEVAHLEVLNGGKLVSSSLLSIVSVFDTGNMGTITMDESSTIEITGPPTLVSEETTNKTEDQYPGVEAALINVLEAIQPFLPAEYHIGFGEMEQNGTTVSYCTILDGDDNIVSTLTLKKQSADTGNTGGDNTPPTVTPPQGNPTPSEPTVNKPDPDDSETPKEDPDDKDDSSSRDPGTDTDNGSAQGPNIVPAEENDSQSNALNIAPRTGDHAAVGIWCLCLLGTVGILCLLAYRCVYKHF